MIPTLAPLLLLAAAPISGAARQRSVPRPRQSTDTTTTTSTCSIGIGRQSGSESWDLTVYDVAQAAQRQDWNILTTLKNQVMGKGESITVASSAGAITITNVDDAPAFDYTLSVQSEGFATRWEDPR